MNSRVLFFLTAISGMIGMISLIALSLCRYWITQNPPVDLSDDGIDQLLLITRASAIAMLASQISIVAFVVFFTLYFIARNRQTPPTAPSQSP